METIPSKHFRKSKFTIGNGFRISKSTIPKSGDGVFSEVAFQIGDHVSEYGGDIKDNSEEIKFEESFYQLSLHPHVKNKVIDGLHVPKTKGNPIGQFINDPGNPKLHNVEFQLLDTSICSTPTVLVVCIKDISVGDELFVSYGAGYWKPWSKITNKKPNKLCTK